MKVLHLADLHLGYTAYPYYDRNGRNQREVDVMTTFSRCASVADSLAPDLIVVGGDVFHGPRPSADVLLDAARIFRRLTTIAPTVIAAGNHDMSRTGGGCVLDVLAQLTGCQVAWNRVGSFPLATAVPDRIGPPQSVPDGGRVMVMHGSVAGIPNVGTHAVPVEALAGWEYVALGHYHVRMEMAPMVWYSGSTDYTSSDIWREARTGIPKGMLLADTAARTVTPVPVGTARRVVSCPDVDATGLGEDEVRSALQSATAALGPGDIGRLLVVEMDPRVDRGLSRSFRTALRGQALHLHLDIRKALPERKAVLSRQTIAEMMADRLMRSTLSPDERQQLIALNTRYLTQAEAETSTRNIPDA